MRGHLEYKIFPWGMRAQDFEKTLKDVEKFANRPEVSEVVSIINSSYGMIVWYKTFRSLKVMMKKP
jgi:hypothetical protein